MESLNNTLQPRDQDNQVNEQVKRLKDILYAKGYDGEFTAYWSGKGNSKNNLNNLLTMMADGSATPLQVLLYPEQSLVADDQPYHYFFELEYTRDNGFKISTMFLEKHARVIHHFYGENNADFPSKDELINLIPLLNSKKQLPVPENKWKRKW